MRDTRSMIVEGVLVLILTAMIQPDRIRLGSVVTERDVSESPRPTAFTAAAASSEGRDTRIRYVVSRRTRVSLAIFDLSGRRVKQLADRDDSAGSHVVAWDRRNEQGRPVQPGVYYYHLSVADGGGRNTLIVVDG